MTIDWGVWGGVFLVVQDNEAERLVVNQADERVAFSAELWKHMLSVSEHPEWQVEGGPELVNGNGFPVLLIGTEGQGLGRVSYQLAGTDGEYVLLQRVMPA